MRNTLIIFILLLCFNSYAQQRQYLVAGQSNARGRGNASLSPQIDTLSAFEYSPTLNQLIHLQDPVGQNANGFQSADDGSPWPAFAKTYHNLTSDTTVIIQAARGASGAHPLSSSPSLSWSQSGLLYTLCSFKINQASAVSGLELDGIVWLQGETDAKAANLGTINQNDYQDALIAIIDRFRDDYGCHLPFYIILVGTDTGEPLAGYDIIRAAQTEVADTHPHTYLIHETTKDFPALGMMQDDVHYTQPGYNDVGTVGATNLVNIENTYYSIAVNGNTTICPEDSVELVAPAMYTAYNWSTGDTTSSIFANTAGTYVVTVTDDNGCSFPLPEINIQEYNTPPAPPLVLIGDNPFCFGDDVILSTPAASAYLWSTGATTTAIELSDPGDYYVQIFDNNGCISDFSDTLTLNMDSVATPIIYTNDNTMFCEGDSAILIAPAGFSAYQWSNGDTSQTITVNTSGSYTCIVSNVNACQSMPSTPINIEVFPSPSPPLTSANGSTLLCPGDSVTLTATVGYQAYQWSNGDTTQTITVANTGFYSCIITDINGCESEPSAPITVLGFSTPPTPTIVSTESTSLCAGDSLTIYAPNGFSAYQWSNGASTQNITVSASGSYTCIITDNNGCQSPPSNSVNVNVALPLPAPTISTNAPTTFCLGESIVLSAPSGFSSYQWSNGATTQNIVVSTTGSYSCAVTDANECLSATSTPIDIIVIQQATPGISAGGATTFCEGDSVTLNAPFGFDGYLWSNGATTQSTVVYDSGSYSCQVINSFGCISSSSVNISITVNPSPDAPEITFSNSLSFCNGDSITLTAEAGFPVYNWSNGATTQSITVYSSGVFSCFVSDANACISPSSTPVTITEYAPVNTPTISLSGAADFCAGDSVILSAPNGFDSYLWSNGATTQNITVYDVGTFTCVVGDINNCISSPSAPVSVLINPNPNEPVIQASGSATFCEGDSVTLNVSAGFDYLWSDGSTSQSITVFESGNYTCTITNAFGCSSFSDVFSTTMNPLPVQPTLTLSGNTEFCQGDSIQITAPAGFNYLWSTGASTQSITIYNTTSNINCQLEDINGCISPLSDMVDVLVNPLPPVPVIDTIGNTTLCAGEMLELQAPAGYDYLWSTGETTSSISIESTGLYSLTIQDTNSCLNTTISPIEITVNPLPATPVITANGATSFCEGDNVILTAPAGFVSYLWNTGETTQSIFVEESGSFTCVVTDNNACQSDLSDAINTLVNPNPETPFIEIIGDTILCPMDSVILNAPAGFAGYMWSNGTQNQELIISESGTYTCYIIDNNGCQSPVSEVVTIEVRPAPPIPDIISSDNLSFCDGDSITLFADDGYESYLWSNGDTTQNIVVSTEDEFFYIATDGISCEDPVSETVATTVRPVPEQPEVYRVGTDSLCTDIIGSNYLWLLNDTLVSGINDPCVVPDISGYWRVIVVANGCPSEVSDSLFYELGPEPPDPDDPKMLEIYPNPSNGFVTIQTTNIVEEQATLELYNVLGQLLYTERLDINFEPLFSHTIDLRGLPDAGYLVVLKGGVSGRFVQKLIIDR